MYRCSGDPPSDTFSAPHSTLSSAPTERDELNENSSAEVARAIADLDRLQVSQTWRVAFVLKSRTDPYWQQVRAGAEAAAADYGVDLQVVGSDRPQTTEFVKDQIVLIAELLKDDELDGLLIGPADSLRLAPIVERAIDRGIPAIAIDTPLNTDGLLTYVGFDNYAAGKAMGEWVVRDVGGEGNVLILDGPPHHDNAIERREGFLAGLRAGQTDVLGIESANWDTDLAAEVTAQWLQEFDDVDAIVAANDGMALGAVRAVQEANRADITITGFDGLAAGLEAVQAGMLAATIDQQPAAQARLGMQLLLNHLENQATYPDFIPLQNRTPISADNLDQFLPEARSEAIAPASPEVLSLASTCLPSVAAEPPTAACP